MRLSDLEKRLKVRFRNQGLLTQALTHKSYFGENRNWPFGHNERLEFLGDAVLELIVSERLFQSFPGATEGQMTQYRSSLVRREVLSSLAMELGLNDYLLLSRSEAKATGRPRTLILGNAYEAVIGAVYLDRGYAAAKEMIARHIFANMKALLAQDVSRNCKSRLQEIAQARFKVTPVYRVLEESGPDHAKLFLIGVYFGERLIAQGHGVSKKLAEESAAEAALALPSWPEP